MNLLIYREKLPTANINAYRWIPQEARDRLLEELSPPELESPPSPFLILTAPTPRDEPSGLGKQEIKDGGIDPVLLKRRLEELEGQIETLKQELRLEKGRWTERLGGIASDHPEVRPEQKTPAEGQGTRPGGAPSLIP